LCIKNESRNGDDMSRKLTDLFYENSDKYPNKEAIWCDGKSLTYEELADYISRYTHFLLSNGVRYGDHIVIPMNNSIESVALFFSSADIGACVVPINPSLPIEAVNTAIDASDAKHIIARRAFYKANDGGNGLNISGCKICIDGEFSGTVSLNGMDKMSNIRPNFDYEVDGDESFILTMTSGSTGNPKPIDLSQNNKYDRAMAHVRVYKISKEDRVLAATPLYHSLAERLVILPLIIGATSILLPRFTPEIWLRCAKEQKPTFTIAVSAQLAQILGLIKDTDETGITSFRSIVSSSALLEERTKNELIDRLKCEFHEMYGASEVSTVTSICFQDSPEKKKSVGKPFDEAKVRILKGGDDSDIIGDCKVNEVGEIACKTVLQCKGYYKQEALMRNAMYEGYFKTGDLGYLDEDGYLYFSGRKKELIITGAVNVYPNDIDEVVGRFAGIAECAAFSYPDEKLGEVVALAAVIKEGSNISSRDIRLYCARNLADFQQPHEIFIVDSLPKNAMGKLRRSEVINHIGVNTSDK